GGRRGVGGAPDGRLRPGGGARRVPGAGGLRADGGGRDRWGRTAGRPAGAAAAEGTRAAPSQAVVRAGVRAFVGRVPVRQLRERCAVRTSGLLLPRVGEENSCFSGPLVTSSDPMGYERHSCGSARDRKRKHWTAPTSWPSCAASTSFHPT